MKTITTTFQIVRAFGARAGKCVGCGKHIRRQRTFERTINPWNRNSDGLPKSYSEVLADVDADRAAWMAKELRCTACE